MEPDAPSVRGAFAAAVGGGFDLFDLGPGIPLNLNLAGLPLTSCAAPPPCAEPAPPLVAAAGKAPAPAPVRGLPAALQPAPEELLRFGGAGLQLPKAPPLAADAAAKGILPPLHIIEGCVL